MIKFFRNIRRKLAAQNKVASYLRYAIGEILLVVIGIFIALQLNNWNQARKDRIQEIKMYKEIRLDLINTMEEVESDLNSHKTILKYTMKLSRDLMDKKPANDSTLLYLLTVGGDSQVYPKTSGFEALKSIGIDLLKNDTVRKQITDCYELGIKRVVIIGQKEDPENSFKQIMKPFTEKYITNSFAPTDLRKIETLRDTFYIQKPMLNGYDKMINDSLFISIINRSIYERINKISVHESAVSRIENTIKGIDTELKRIDK